MNAPTIRVIGFGNTLHGNDGFAERVISKVAQSSKIRDNDDVECLFAGTAGLNAMPLFDKPDRVFVVDVIHRTLTVDSLAWYSPQDIIEIESERNDHGMGLGYLFKALLSVSTSAPKIDCLLCASETPQSYTLNMSEEITRQIPHAVTQIVRRIGNNE